MFGIENFGAFLLAGVLLNLTPGADTMYILGRSISGGKTAGMLSAFGIATGSLVHTFFAALGLSVIIAESATAFMVIKYLGAAYLIYLGALALWKKQERDIKIETIQDHSKGIKIYLSGIITNVLNPKVALFYLAFLPQFIDPEYTHPVYSFLLLGAVFTFTGTIWCIIIAFYSAKMAGKLRRNSKIKYYLDKLTGVVFIGLGLKLALSDR